MKLNIYQIYSEGERVEGLTCWGTVVVAGHKPVVQWDDGTITRGKYLKKRANVLKKITLWQEKLWQMTSRWF